MTMIRVWGRARPAHAERLREQLAAAGLTPDDVVIGRDERGKSVVDLHYRTELGVEDENTARGVVVELIAARVDQASVALIEFRNDVYARLDAVDEQLIRIEKLLRGVAGEPSAPTPSARP